MKIDLIAMDRSFSRFRHNVKVLGWKNGYLLWKMQNRVLRNYNYLLELESTFRRAALELQSKDPKFASVCQDFADRCRRDWVAWLELGSSHTDDHLSQEGS